MPQIELALGRGEAAGLILALVFRVLDPVEPQDRAALVAFARAHRFELWFQPSGPDSIELVDSAGRVRSGGLAVSVRPAGVRRHDAVSPDRFHAGQPPDQRSPGLARAAPARRALDERVADLFCGLGNFSLPLARRAASVLGIEGAQSLVDRARAAADMNGLADRVDFRVANLFETTTAQWRALGAFDRVLIDPPREGALALASALSEDRHKPRRIVYVSCNPATLARDAGLLVHTGGFVLSAAGAIDMFPHTSHVESIAVFDPA